MRRIEFNQIILAAASGSLIASGGGVAVAIFNLTLAGYLALCTTALLGGLGVFLVLRQASSSVRRQMTLVIDQTIGQSGESDHLFASLSSESSRIISQIQSMQASLREEAAARQLAATRTDELFAVLQALDDPVVVFDSLGTIRMANDASGKLLGSERSIFDPEKPTVFGCPNLCQQIRDALNNGDFRGRRFDCELTIPGDIETGTRIYDVRLISLGNAETETFLLAMRDLTREREISRIKSDFVSKASHELRTPLASIRAYLEMIVDEEISDPMECKAVMNSMLADTDRLSSLVENMLNISRIEAGIMRPALERTDLGEIARKVLHRLEPGAAQKQISLSLSAASMDLTVEADPGMLEQVVENLASNAVKYTPDGGRVVITVDTDPLERTVVVSVSDTGLGIPLEARERVFDKFFRVPSYERMAKGTGLGLNLCRNIVESVHRGRIGVDSRVGEGSRFWFSVPVGFAGARAA